jgi:hypothetical protein
MFRWRDVSNWAGALGALLFILAVILKGAGIWGSNLGIWEIFGGAMGLRGFFLPVDVSTIVKAVKGESK